MRARDQQSGQASVEFIALLPVLAALALGAWQLVVVAHAWGLAGSAARVAARAAGVGADPALAARRALPGSWGRRVRVLPVRGGVVTVRLSVPLVVAGARLADVRASGRIASAGGSP